jgi:hypothetical protein
MDPWNECSSADPEVGSRATDSAANASDIRDFVMIELPPTCIPRTGAEMVKARRIFVLGFRSA